MQGFKCPFCGNDTFVEGAQDGYGSVTPANKVWTFKAQKLIHVICLNCGTVVKSYVKNPKKLVVSTK